MVKASLEIGSAFRLILLRQDKQDGITLVNVFRLLLQNSKNVESEGKLHAHLTRAIFCFFKQRKVISAGTSINNHLTNSKN